MKRPENVILRGETRLFLSILLAITLSVFAATNVFAEPFAYITNLQSATVSVIDTSSNSVVATIPVGVNPIGVAVSPAATRVYVTNGGAYNGTGFNGNTVSVIDTASNTVVQTITGVGPGPYGVAINPAGTRVYVTNYGPTATPSTISVIDTSNNTVIAAIPVGIFPAGVVVSPDGSVVYVGNYGSNTISVINSSTNLVSQTIAATAPGGLALNPPGTRLYVGHYYGPASISVYDTATLAPLPIVPLDYVPWAVSVNPAGTRLYTSNTWSSGVSVIDTGNNTVLPTINVGSLPHGLALDPTGTRLYVAQAGANSVGVIDTSSNAMIANVPVGNYPVAFGKFIGAQSCVEPPAGLVSWWPGDGNANDIQDGNNGTLQNEATFAPGMVEQTFSFDGLNDEVNVPYAANLNPTQALTLDAWVNINSLTNAANGGYQGVVSMSEGQRAYWFGITGTGSNHMGTAGNVHLEGFGLGSAWRTSAAVITPGQWYHIAGVIEPSTNRFEIYVNGVLQPAVSSGGGPHLASVSNVPFRIGFSDPGFPYHFNGLIDEVSLFNRALSAAEIQAIFTAGSAGKCKGAALNSAPVANAGQDQTPYVGNTVTLDGSGSYDVDGNLLTFKWVFTSVPTESTATLSDSTSVNPTFTIDKAGTYVVSLTVNDGTVDSAADTVTISTLNSAPVADAGTDQTPYVNDTVTLNGSGSYDVDGNLLTYSWAFTTVPQGSAASLVNPASVNPTFTVDKAGTYVVSLMVNDGTVNSTADTVTISTLNSAPVANAGLDQSVYVGNTVTLDGSGSSDVDGNLLTYSWAFTSKPSGSTATLNNAAAVNPTFTVDKAGTYVVSLIVNDGTVNSAPDTITISTINVAPVANAGNDQTVPEESTVTLDGSGSSDADGNALTYSWAFTTKPTESTAILSGTTTMNPTFTADEEGTYVVSLIVNDGTVNSAPDTVTITAEESEVEDVEAEVEIKPETINLKSKGKFKAFIELPESYSADEVVLATVVCEGAHAIDGRVDGEDRYIATFNTQDLRITVSSKDEEVTLTVSGELEDGTKFTGSDTVKVKGKDKDR